MARIGAKQNLLYYPTDQDAIAELTEHHLTLPTVYQPNRVVRVFDPCAGEGLAVNKLCEGLNKFAKARKLNTIRKYSYGSSYTVGISTVEFEPWGVEIDIQRAMACAELLGQNRVVNSPIEHIDVAGQADILYENPPYDYLFGKRAEITWLEMTTPYLTIGGTLVFVVPDMFVDDGRYAPEMRSVMTRLGYNRDMVIRFPDESYPQFKQVFILATKSTSSNGVSLKTKGKIAGREGNPNEEYSWLFEMNWPNSSSGLKVTKSKRTYVPTPSVFEEEEPHKSLVDIIGSPGITVVSMKTLTPMRMEHAAMIAAAGMLNSTVIDGEVVKGTTIKKEVVTSAARSSQSGRSEVIETLKSEVHVAQFCTINIAKAEVKTINSMDNRPEFEAILENHAAQFVDMAVDMYPPIFTMEDMYRYNPLFGKIHAPRRIDGVQNGLYPQQMFRAAAIVEAWAKVGKVVTVNGEPGVGKTVVSFAAVAIKAMRRKPHLRKVVVLLPPKQDLVDKWKEEIELSLREFDPLVIHAESLSDVQAAFSEEERLTFILLKETTAKMSSGWTNILVPERRQPKSKNADELPKKCPSCGKTLVLATDKEDTKWKCTNEDCRSPHMWQVARNYGKGTSGTYEEFEGRVANARSMATVAVTRKRLVWEQHSDKTWTRTLRKVTDMVVSDNWYQYLTAPPNKGFAKYPIARYIRDHYPDGYLLIMDECHHYKGSDTARGYAAQDLLASAMCSIQMTGTLYNGMASSLYMQLWRALPEFRKTWGVGDASRFVDEYGLTETLQRSYAGRTSNTSSGYKKFTDKVTERPGVHPAMIALLLPSALFFGIRDIEAILPKMSEHTLFVDRPAEANKVESYLDRVRTVAVQRITEDGDMSLLSQWTHGKQMAWDMMSQGDEMDGYKLEPIKCETETGMWPKEEALVRLIAQEKRAGRPCIVYVGQINRRDTTPRLIGLLEKYGMKATVLRSTETHRVQFVRDSLANGADAIFTNPALVKEGIDLLEIPTYIWMYADSDSFLVQQSNRRGWRPGAKKAVKIFYLAYNKTPQAEKMSRLAKKVGAAQSLHGEIQQGIAKILGEEDFVSRLQTATIISTEHFESDMTVDDLEPLSVFETKPEVEVEVIVKSARPRSVKVTVKIEDFVGYRQMSMF